MLDIDIAELMRNLDSVRVELLDSGDVAGAAIVALSLDTVRLAWLSETL